MEKKKPFQFNAKIKEINRNEEKGKMTVEVAPAVVAKIPTGEVLMTVISSQPKMFDETEEKNE